MNILAVESSGSAAGAAVVSGDVLRAEGYANTGLTHSESLLPLIDSVLKSAKMKVSDIDLFAVSSGPGSFTGLRIGIGTVKGLAYGQDKNACAVPTLQALCYNVPLAEGIVCPIIDARHGEVYNALYKWEGNKLTEMCAPRAILLSELCSSLPPQTTFVGDGVLQYADFITQNTKNPHITPFNLCLPRASGVAMAARTSEWVNSSEIEPIYLKKPQAERERENKVLHR